jgi:hypothetical protein
LKLPDEELLVLLLGTQIDLISEEFLKGNSCKEGVDQKVYSLINNISDFKEVMTHYRPRQPMKSSLDRRENLLVIQAGVLLKFLRLTHMCPSSTESLESTISLFLRTRSL